MEEEWRHRTEGFLRRRGGSFKRVSMRRGRRERKKAGFA